MLRSVGTSLPGLLVLIFFLWKKVLNDTGCLFGGLRPAAEYICGQSFASLVVLYIKRSSLNLIKRSYCTSLQLFGRQTAFICSRIFQIVAHQSKAPAANSLPPITRVFTNILLLRLCFHFGNLLENSPDDARWSHWFTPVLR